jgi:hypothetical protein
MTAADFDEHVRERWFTPITDRIQSFENKMGLFAELGSVVEPDSPDWAVNCTLKLIKPHGNLAGMPLAGKCESEEVGAMIGAKASVCSAMARAHKFAQVWPRKSREKFVEVFGLEATQEAEAIWKRFAEELHPEFEEIRRFAVNLAMQQDYFEDVEFHRGLSKGLTFMLELGKTIRKATTKGQQDAQKRAAVYFFAICSCEVIDANRTDISWPELSQACDEAFDHKISFDEDAVKKILQRSGLRVGKPGRRIEISR